MDREEREELLGDTPPRELEGAGGGTSEEVWREVTVMVALRHPNICRLRHCFVSASGAAANQAADAQLPFSESPPLATSERHVPGCSGGHSPVSQPAPSPQPAPAGASSSSFNGIAQLFVVMPLSLKQMLQALYPSGIQDDALLAAILHPLLIALAYLHSAIHRRSMETSDGCSFFASRSPSRCTITLSVSLSPPHEPTSVGRGGRAEVRVNAFDDGAGTPGGRIAHIHDAA